MTISARIENAEGIHVAQVKTNDTLQSVAIPSRSTGFGSSLNGGELLFLALATCYCNDVYREAARRNLAVQRVEVEVKGDFGGEGEPAKKIEYQALVVTNGTDEQTLELMQATDKVAEIQNSLRAGVPVKFVSARSG